MTINYLCYIGFPNVLEGFSDSNWISDSDEMKSTSGYVFTLGGGAVSWNSSKKICIAQSTMEVKFIALKKANMELSGSKIYWCPFMDETNTVCVYAL